MNTEFIASCAEQGQFSSHSDNAYASPESVNAHKPDWSLAKRVAFWFSMLAIAAAMVLFTACWSQYRTIESVRMSSNLLTVIRDFFFGWVC
jgi:hypothetical protein